MTKRADDVKAVLSRRDLLKRVGIVGAAAAAVPVDAFASSAALAVPPAAFPPAQVQARREPLETLDRCRGRHARSDRRAPDPDRRATDQAQPRPARRTTSIARSAARSRRRSTRTAPASQPSIAYARGTRGAPFDRSSRARDQDAVLNDMETNIATGFAPDARRSSIWSGRTPSRARSAIPTTEATRISSDGI